VTDTVALFGFTFYELNRLSVGEYDWHEQAGRRSAPAPQERRRKQNKLTPRIVQVGAIHTRAQSEKISSDFF
jgi:hypothetical protein